MSGQFSREELEQLRLDPYEPAAIARCPSCGEDIVIGVRSDTRNISLAHAGHRDPTDATGTRWISGCDLFVEAMRYADVLKRLYNAGARFARLEY
jgi:hypothetical protein